MTRSGTGFLPTLLRALAVLAISSGMCLTASAVILSARTGHVFDCTCFACGGFQHLYESAPGDSGPGTLYSTAGLLGAGAGEGAAPYGFVLNDVTAGGMSAAALSGFQQAAAAWESLFDDPITIRLDIEFKPLIGTVLGQTSITSFGQSYANIRSALVGDSFSADDATAVANLQAGPSLRLLTTNHLTGAQFVDDNNTDNNNFLDIARANAKALGLSDNLLAGGSDIPNPDDTSVRDAKITFNSNTPFDFDPSDGVDFGKTDFIGVAIHEIGHALGFISGVDVVDAVSEPTLCSGCTATDLNGFAVMNTLDLYRYSGNAIANNALSAHQGGSPFFAIAPSPISPFNSLGSFSSGAFDGSDAPKRQASHWKDSLSLGVMDPTLGSSEVALIRALDLRAFDVIGYQLSADGLNNSQITSATASVAFGRVMVGTSPTPKDVTLNKIGGKATTFDALSNPNFSTNETGAFAGGALSETFQVDITSGIVAAGAKSFALNVDNVAPTATAVGRGSLDANDLVSITATAVDNRQIDAAAVDFGSVFVGTPVSGNSLLTTTGADNVRTRVTVNGAAVAADANGVGVNAGSAQLFDAAADTTTRTLAGAFATAGAKSGTLDFSRTGEGLAGEAVNDVEVDYTASAFDHGTGSFVDTGDPQNPEAALLIDFGTRALGEIVAPVGFDIFNLIDTASFTGGVEFDAPSAAGDVSVLSTDLQAITATLLAAGNSLSFAANFDTSTAGVFESIFTLNLGDESTILGAGDLADLTLTLRGEVLAPAVAAIPEPSSAVLWLLMAALVSRARLRRAFIPAARR